MPSAEASGAEPSRNCPLCPRLKIFRDENRKLFPDFFNAPVPSFGDPNARLLVVGLAPGIKGANRTGRPFTGDYAGMLLYGTLAKLGFSRGTFDARADDGLTLIDCRITNAARCVPPQNKPLPAEVKTCRPFLISEIAALPKLQVILSLGHISHDTVLATLGHRRAAYPFKHGAIHTLPDGLRLADSYHCSRYNTNTGVLTVEMFEAAIARIAASLT